MHTRHDPCPRILAYRPPRIAMALLAAAAVIQVALPATAHSLPMMPLAGGIVGALGFAAMMRAWWLFRVANTAICPTATTTSLITRDIFGISRNPMYLGITLMLLGVALATGGAPFYLAALAFFVVIDAAFCPYEERKLEAHFGRRFRIYCSEVRRWL